MADGLTQLPDGPSPALDLRLYLGVLAPTVGVIIAVAALAIASLSVLSAVRAYAGGESQWSKARSEAVDHLRDYARRGNEIDFRRFEESLGVPLGDRAAREAMEQDPPDQGVARRGLIAGGNDPSDVDGMVSLYLRFSRLSLFQAPREAWEEGDRLIDRLRDTANRLHDERHASAGDATAVDALFQEINDVNGALMAAERRFGAGLSTAGRKVEGGLVAGLITITVLLSFASALFLRRSLTRRAASERLLASVSERWKLAAEAGGLGLYDWTIASDVLRLDAKAALLSGLPLQSIQRDNLVTQRASLAAQVHPADLDLIRRLTQASVASGEPYKARYRVRRNDGGWRTIETTGMLEKGGGDRDRRMVGVVRDVTEEERQAELALERDAAERAARARMEFLSRLSHELRTPLNAILGFAQLLMLEGQGGLTATQTERVRLILDSGRQLLKLVEDVLDLTRIDAGAVSVQIEPVDVTLALRTSLAMIGGVAQAYQVQVRDMAPHEPVWALADVRRLQQVLVNLLTNGCKYNRRNGDVTVDAGVEAGRVWLSVRDTGVGITEAERAELFQPFKRLPSTAGQVEGTGLGLFIVRSLLERMNGSIALDSVWSEGSTFTVWLPLSTASPGTAASHWP